VTGVQTCALPIFLDGRPEAVAGVDQLVHQTLGHALLSALTRESDQPAQGQRGGPGGTNLDRHLVGRATDTAAADLERGLDVVQGALEHDKRVLAGLFLSTLQSVVDNTLGERTLAVDQHLDRKSTRLNSSHVSISYAVFCLKKNN